MPFKDPVDPSGILVDRAEAIADEAWRRAFSAGADPAFSPPPASEPKAEAEFGPWFLVRRRDEREAPSARLVVRENKTTGDYEVGTLVHGSSRVSAIQTEVPSVLVQSRFLPIEPVFVDVLPDDNGWFVWTADDHAEALRAARLWNDHGLVASHARRAQALATTPLPSW